MVLPEDVSGNFLVALRIELYGIALVKWDAEEGSDILIDPDEKIKGDCNREQYFHKKVSLLEKGLPFFV